LKVDTAILIPLSVSSVMKTNLITLAILALFAVVLSGCTTTTETTTTRTREQSSLYAR